MNNLVRRGTYEIEKIKLNQSLTWETVSISVTKEWK